MFGLIGLVYEMNKLKLLCFRVRSDFDELDGKLMAAHFYCTQVKCNFL